MAVGRQALIRRREELGLTQEDVAHRLGIHPKTVQRCEAGDTKLKIGLRPRLADVLGVSSAQVALWLSDDDPQAPNGHVIPPWLGHLASLEQGAAEILAFEPVVIHALLQTERYATAVESIGRHSSRHVAEKVQARIARQGVLRRSPDPLRLHVVLDESTLLRPAGGPEVMADQLDQLADLADRPNVSVQIMPLAPEVFPAAFGAFKILTSPEASSPYMAYVEDSGGPHYLDRPHEIDRHVALFEHLSGHALGEAESIECIRKTCKERYQ